MIRQLPAVFLALATLAGPSDAPAENPDLPSSWPHMNGHPVANAKELLDEATEAFFKTFSPPDGGGCYFLVDPDTGEIKVAAVDCFPVNSEGVHGISFPLRLMTPIDPPPESGAPIYLGLDPEHYEPDNSEALVQGATMLWAEDLQMLDPPDLGDTVSSSGYADDSPPPLTPSENGAAWVWTLTIPPVIGLAVVILRRKRSTS